MTLPVARWTRSVNRWLRLPWRRHISHGTLTPPKTAVFCGGNFFKHIFFCICRTLPIQSALNRWGQAGSFDILDYYSRWNIYQPTLTWTWKLFRKMAFFASQNFFEKKLKIFKKKKKFENFLFDHLKPLKGKKHIDTFRLMIIYEYQIWRALLEFGARAKFSRACTS